MLLLMIGNDTDATQSHSFQSSTPENHTAQSVKAKVCNSREFVVSIDLQIARLISVNSFLMRRNYGNYCNCN